MTLHSFWHIHLIPHSFMLQDILGSLLAVVAFAAVLYAPGYLLAYAVDLFGFRQSDMAERSSWAIACSLGFSPIAAHLLGRTASLAGLCWLFASAAAVTVLLLWMTRQQARWPSPDRRRAALVAVGWTAFVLLMLVDFQVGSKLYFSVAIADQSYRIAFTDAVVRTGIPPANPLYFAGSLAPMRYYYFWYVLCAVVVKLAHVSARQAFIASSVWAGFGLLAIVRLYCCHFFRWPRKQRWLAYVLLAISGADLIPAVGQAVLQPTLNGDTEWWSVDPIDGWPDSLLWVPHHVASVLCCLLAFLCLWRMMERRSARGRHAATAVAALACSSAFGLSVYVAFGFAVLIAVWLLWLLLTKDEHRWALWRHIAVVGVATAVMLAPFLRELQLGTASHAAETVASGNAASSHVFTLSVRRMIDSGLLTGLPLFASWNRSHPVLLDQALRMALLAPGLAMELGLFGAALVLLLRNRRLHAEANSRVRTTSVFFALSGLVMTMFLSSAVITNNDFGYRAVMLPQFFLLLLATDVLGTVWLREASPTLLPSEFRRKLLGSLFVLGALGTVYWAFLLRAWLPLEAARPQTGYASLPDQAFQIRSAMATLERDSALGAVVSFRPIDPVVDRQDAVMVPNEFYQRLLVMDTGRQFLNAEGKCAVHFGGDPRRCSTIQQATAALYATSTPSAQSAVAYCHQFGVQYLLLSAWDPAWTTRSGWPATLPLVAQTPDLRIFRCDNQP